MLTNTKPSFIRNGNTVLLCSLRWEHRYGQKVAITRVNVRKQTVDLMLSDIVVKEAKAGGKDPVHESVLVPLAGVTWDALKENTPVNITAAAKKKADLMETRRKEDEKYAKDVLANVRTRYATRRNEGEALLARNRSLPNMLRGARSKDTPDITYVNFNAWGSENALREHITMERKTDLPMTVSRRIIETMKGVPQERWVNWCSMGGVTPEQALAFGEALVLVAKRAIHEMEEANADLHA